MIHLTKTCDHCGMCEEDHEDIDMGPLISMTIQIDPGGELQNWAKVHLCDEGWQEYIEIQPMWLQRIFALNNKTHYALEEE